MYWRTKTDVVDWRVDDRGTTQRAQPPARKLARFGVAAVGLAALLVACAPLALTPVPAPQVGAPPAQPAAQPAAQRPAEPARPMTTDAETPERAPTIVSEPPVLQTPEHSHASQPVDESADEAAKLLPEGVTRLPQPSVAPPVNRTQPALVKVDLETSEVTALLADGVAYRYWTFNGTVPGPMIRVRQGDTVELTLRNAPDTGMPHSINLHAVNGPGGGSVDTQVAPGDASTIRFQALHPGVYVYHCMTPMVGQHVANGMYGMIVVEPPEGLPKVDREFYIMQGDFYLKGQRGEKGLREFSFDKLLDENPEYVVYNGSVGSLTGERALQAKVGETVRFFFGVGGPNKDSAFHVVGEGFDVLHPEGASEALTDVQTTLVPPGGATMAELKLDAPGHYMIEDHHITRLEKGAMADFNVEGDANPDVFAALGSPEPTE
jgi:nitrite reductase (NO-forming)